MSDSSDHNTDRPLKDKPEMDKPEPVEQTAPYEHCRDCGTRTGGGRCSACKDLGMDFGR